MTPENTQTSIPIELATADNRVNVPTREERAARGAEFTRTSLEKLRVEETRPGSTSPLHLKGLIWD